MNSNKLVLLLLLFFPGQLFAQGRNSNWLVGYNTGINEMSRFVFDSSSYLYNQETRKMQFWGTEATISDEQGNFLMSSNGVWIANANNDTMMNGSGLNPGPFVNSFGNGLVIDYGNIFLPFPGDSAKYILFHQTQADPNSNYPSTELYYSIIDITMDNGFGALISKNNIAFVDTICWGFTACRHGNGRDWWIVSMKDSSDIAINTLLDSNGAISCSFQTLNFYPWPKGNSSQPTFSNDGQKFITTTYDNPISKNSSIVISDFDRCTGTFSNTQSIQLTSGSYLWGLAFSPSGQFIYACSSGFIFQINSSTLSVDTVAVYDGFISGFPPNCCATDFWDMYLAANGKIYITSGSSVQHHHVINFPDSAGTACDVQQHAINLGVWSLRAVPNHPNYYLGPLVGSPCDSLTGMFETQHDFKFSVMPNPSNGNFRIMYLLPQNQKGKLEVFDVNGRKVYELKLPPWSTMQLITLPEHIAPGVYNCVLHSGNATMNRKIVVIK